MAEVGNLPLGRRFEHTMAMNAYQETKNRDREPAWRKEVQEMVQRRFSATGCETKNTENPGYYASVTNIWRPSESSQLNTEPPPREKRSAQAMPNPPFLACDVEMPASCENLTLPVTPSAEATTTEFQAHIETLGERLRTAEVRIEHLQKQQSDSQRAYTQAVCEGQEVELARLRKTKDTLKQLLDQAQGERDQLQRELRESRAREADIDQQLHRMNLEQARVTAKVGTEDLRENRSACHTATVPSMVGLHRHQDCIQGTRQTQALDDDVSTEFMPKSSRKRRGTVGGWDLPKGQTHWKGWLP